MRAAARGQRWKRKAHVMKRNVFAAIFMCLMMGCGVETPGAQRGDSSELLSSGTVAPQSNQGCLAGCLQDCGAVCGSLGVTKPACIHECAQENQECRDFCANH
jgi:hypothetical protein